MLVKNVYHFSPSLHGHYVFLFMYQIKSVEDALILMQKKKYREDDYFHKAFYVFSPLVFPGITLMTAVLMNDYSCLKG